MASGSGSANPQAVATRGGRIVAVGSEAECRRAIGLPGEGAPESSPVTDGPAIVDLGGAALVPGFNDVHLHPLPMCFFEHHVDLTGRDSLSDVLDALRDRLRETGEDSWVLGLQINEEQLAERRLPSLAELDALGGTRPVVLLRRDGHTAVGNQAALEAAGITRDAADPPGGAFERDADGSLTGVCFENAAQTLLGAVPLPALEQFRIAARRVFARLASNGITSVGAVLQTDAEGPAGAAGEFEVAAMELLLDELPAASHAILCGTVPRALAARDTALHRPELGRRVGALKIFLDGTLGARTACMHAPYHDAVDRSGYLTLDLRTAADRMEAAHLAGLQICVHAIGDAANDQALDLFDALLRRHPPDHAGDAPRHRIEHASVLAPDSIARFSEIGVIAAVQPLFIRSERDWLADRLGPARRAHAYPFASMLRAGVTLAGSSDAPIEDPDPLAGMLAAVTRHGFETEESITAEQSLRMYTSDAAFAQQREDETGVIAEGHRADLTVLSSDPLRTGPDSLTSVEVALTVFGGRLTFARSSQPAEPAPQPTGSDPR
jgi:hypothetical protein